jgi:zinc/manganese transport system ATP-binding protein
VFVTHEINPVQPYVDRVLYLVDGRWAVGAPDEVLTSERLSELYNSDIEVLTVHGRTIVVGSDDNHHHV